jgi:hypothetical protein
MVPILFDWLEAHTIEKLLMTEKFWREFGGLVHAKSI